MAEPWAVVSSWTTPAPLFVLLNVVIGSIALISVFASRKNTHTPPPDHYQAQYQIHRQDSAKTLLRAPSLFSRVTSFNFSGQSYGSPSAFDEAAAPPPENSNSPYLAPAPTFLSRMTSFNSLHLHRSGESETYPPPPTDEQPPENSNSPYLASAPSSFNSLYLQRSVESETVPPAMTTNEQPPEPQPAPIERAPSLFQRMTSFSRVSMNKSVEPETNPPQSEQSERKIERAPSLLSRMSSFDFSFYRSTEKEPESAPADAREARVTRSATEPKKKKKSPSAMKKSPSEKTEKETASFANDEVDAKADDFINRFKQQLRLQRLDSLLRYRNSAGEN